MAQTTDIGICNLALGLLGSANRIASLTERSAEAVACTAFFDEVRDATLRDFDWPFAKSIVALVEAADNPTTEWAYAYRVPSTCLKVRRIQSGNVREGYGDRVKYLLAYDDSGQIILTNEASAILEFTKRITVVGHLPSDFRLTLAAHLAAWIAPQVTGGDKFKLAERVMKSYLLRIENTKANAQSEESPPELAESEFIRGRN
jgi:hypothetical protein